MTGRGGESGQSTVEYVLLLAIISIPICLALLRLFQAMVGTIIQRIVSDFSNGPM